LIFKKIVEAVVYERMTPFLLYDLYYT